MAEVMSMGELERLLHCRADREDLRVRDDNEFGLFAQKPAGERADVQSRTGLAEPVFFPDFRKPLPLAVVVAENVDSKALAQPAVKLGEEFAALRFGDLRIGRTFAHWTKGLKRSKERSAGL